jgi:hypothetical protein
VILGHAGRDLLRGKPSVVGEDRQAGAERQRDLWVSRSLFWI